MTRVAVPSPYLDCSKHNQGPEPNRNLRGTAYVECETCSLAGSSMSISQSWIHADWGRVSGFVISQHVLTHACEWKQTRLVGVEFGEVSLRQWLLNCRLGECPIGICAVLIDTVKSAEKFEIGLWLYLCVSGYRSQQLTLHIEARSDTILLMPFPLPGNGLIFFKVSIVTHFFNYIYLLKNQLLVLPFKFHFLYVSLLESLTCFYSPMFPSH